MTATKPHVVITDFINDSLDVEREVLDGVATVEACDALDERELVGKIEQADAVMMYHNLSLTAFTVKRLEQCKLIVRCGVGFDNVDHALARELGIPVANVPDYGTEEVADSAIGMALAMTRGIHQFNHADAISARSMDVSHCFASVPSSRPGFWNCRTRPNRHGDCPACARDGDGRSLL